jgi:hypothetical protein
MKAKKKTVRPNNDWMFRKKENMTAHARGGAARRALEKKELKELETTSLKDIIP